MKESLTKQVISDQFGEHDNNIEENKWNSHGEARLNISSLHATVVRKYRLCMQVTLEIEYWRIKIRKKIIYFYRYTLNTNLDLLQNI